MAETRHRARGVERRAEILRAALEIIAERGYRGATLANVAQRVGLTQQGILHYFPTKEALLVGVLEERDDWDAMATFGRGGASAHADDPSHSPWNLDNLGLLIEYNAMRRGIIQTFSALLGESITDGHPAREFFRRRYAWTRRQVAETLRAHYGDTLPSGLTPEQVAPLALAVLDGIQYQWLLDPDEVDMTEAFESLRVLLGPPS
ncbi:TetR/AcrR family transcriptional regulator [Streptomyces sp. NPDC005438]|uniref:TetR/AcrR family transcriptional regulator n=1 Tax=Streptomyces sp. NPDC005438 TaxID=3156880 RepID=UPI0033BFA722